MIVLLSLIFSSLVVAKEPSTQPTAPKEPSSLPPTERIDTQAPPPPPPIAPEVTALRKSYWTHHHSAYVGYRRDRQEFDAFGPGLLNTRTQVKDRNAMHLIVGSHIEFKKLVTTVSASYGWLVSGETRFRDPGNSPPLTFPSFSLGAGYNIDVRAALGWKFALFTRPNVTFSFIPSVGYNYDHMMNDPQGVKRYTLPDTHNVSTCYFPKPNQQDWFGPFVEGKFQTIAWNFFSWVLFCQYHWPYLVAKSKTQIETYSYDASGALVSDELSQINSVMKSGDLGMVLAGTSLKFSFGQGWAVGAHFEGATTWKNGRNIAQLTQENFFATPIDMTKSHSVSPALIRWTFYAISFMVDRRF